MDSCARETCVFAIPPPHAAAGTTLTLQGMSHLWLRTLFMTEGFCLVIRKLVKLSQRCSALKGDTDGSQTVLPLKIM